MASESEPTQTSTRPSMSRKKGKAGAGLTCAIILCSTLNNATCRHLSPGELAIPEERTIDPIYACEKVPARMPNPPQIHHAGDKAFYSPMTDRITMPPRGLFENAEEYWSTFWHEARHASSGMTVSSS